jgi:hypothetical protein
MKPMTKRDEQAIRSASTKWNGRTCAFVEQIANPIIEQCDAAAFARALGQGVGVLGLVLVLVATGGGQGSKRGITHAGVAVVVAHTAEHGCGTATSGAAVQNGVERHEADDLRPVDELRKMGAH